MSTDTAALFVTATPPTPNGDLHLGHFSGPYLAADVYARHQRRRRATVVAATGIDDHQTYTDLRAWHEERTAEDVAEDFGDRIERAWADLGVRWDLVSRPRRSKHHRPLVEQFVTTLVARGDIVARTRPLPWCPACEEWAYEAYVRGKCPHCGTPACGNACEVCCRPNDCADLVDPECNRCGGPVELRDCERLYFPLAPHRERLSRFWSEVEMNAHLAAVCDRMDTDGLPEIAVSHPGPWGIPVPVPGFEDHTVYVWFEMAAGYLATAAEGAEALGKRAEYGELWGGGEVVQCFGIDNGYFHAVLFPALMSAYDPEITLPSAFLGNEFYRLDGQKFSTSRRHAIWIGEALEQAPADHLRLYLCLDRPAAAQTSFTWPEFRATIGEGLLPRWSAWLEAAQRRFELASAGPSVEAARLSAPLLTLLDALDQAYSAAEFSPRRAYQLLELIAAEGAEAGAENEYFADAPNGRAAFIAAVDREAAALAAFAAGLAPLAPVMAEQLWSALGLSGTAEDTPWREVPGLRPDWRAVTGLPARCPLFGPSGGCAVTAAEPIGVIGIGLGPSNLSLAALAEPVPDLDVRVLERQRSLRWHPGMMVDEAELQVSYLKDLVTLVDPTNRFSFLNHLADRGRLHRFLLATAGAATFRKEFADYYQWAAERLPSVHWDTGVTAVELDGDRLAVHTDAGGPFHTRNLVLGSGRTPNLPEFVTGHRLDTVFHSSRFKLISPDTAGRDVAVIGGGQSGAEIVRTLLSDAHALPASITWITSRVNFLPLDDSPFVNEWFQPPYVSHFTGLAPDRQRYLLERQRLASDGISENLLRDIYRRLYYLDVTDEGRVRHRLLTSRRVVDLVERDGRYLLHVTADDLGHAERHEADLVVCCTGYRAELPSYLDPIRPYLDLDGELLRLAADYRVHWSGPPSVRLYAQNFGELSHGIADPNLSLVPWRCAHIINSITGRRVYRVDEDSSTVRWTTEDKAVPAGRAGTEPGGEPR